MLTLGESQLLTRLLAAVEPDLAHQKRLDQAQKSSQKINHV
jgi:hypothetical protein